jgi:hypothetical protein
VALGEWLDIKRDYQRAMSLFTIVARRGRSSLSKYAAEMIEETKETIARDRR